MSRSAPSADQLDALVAEARAARDRAYAPYSRFHVGAALLADDGRVIPGANVENASYGLSMCAERTAAFRAASEGARRLVAVAVVASNEEPTWPCGACRQVLWEFGPDMMVVSEGSGGRREERRLADLLPDAFGPADLA
ncbi:MAG TPA: cytidine deaminase [Actinomycetota bacterium]|nr:cytidine deaminase [Actinomycetota bacterium]